MIPLVISPFTISYLGFVFLLILAKVKCLVYLSFCQVHIHLTMMRFVYLVDVCMR